MKRTIKWIAWIAFVLLMTFMSFAGGARTHTGPQNALGTLMFFVILTAVWQGLAFLFRWWMRRRLNRFSLVLIGLGRNSRRTLLTMASVLIALFLFCTLRGVVDTLQDAVRVGSETRLVTRNAISLVFPLPLSYRERIAGVNGVELVSYSNWFGGHYPQQPKKFFAKFGVDAATYFPLYASDMEITEASPPQGPAQTPPGVDPKLAAFMSEQTACVVGEKLMTDMGWKLGQTITIAGDIYPGEWPFTIRAVYRAKTKSFGDDAMFFHWKYLREKAGMSMVGTYEFKLSDPTHASKVVKAVDAMFINSAYQTRTETERAFQAGFVSMYGNIPFLMKVIGFAIAFAILLVAANTMMMAVRERTSEFAVMKTLGFDDGQVFRIVLVEAAIITLGAGLAGALLAKLALEASGFNAGGAFPPMSVHWGSVALGLAVALVMGAASGLIPAMQAARLRIVEALRRAE
jgi:putative ABC transport system permease protein